LDCVIKVREVVDAHGLIIEVWRLLLYLIAIETVWYFTSHFAFFEFQFVVVFPIHSDFFNRYFWVFLYLNIFFCLLSHFVFKILFRYLVIPFFIQGTHFRKWDYSLFWIKWLVLMDFLFFLLCYLILKRNFKWFQFSLKLSLVICF
jgi:hypothetical protein